MFLLDDTYWETLLTPQKGLGIFAKKTISKGTIIADYLGRLIQISDYDLDLDKHGLYLMYYSDQIAIYPNLAKSGPHLLNHSCAPNCWMYVYKGHTLFFALRTILPKEELTISYLLSPDDGSCHLCTHQCKCGYALCRGSMHLTPLQYEIWKNYQHHSHPKNQKTKVKVGTDLQGLISYPTILATDLIYATIKEVVNST